jgi:glycosyltransferase involved in cell wall biosynthesis
VRIGIDYRPGLYGRGGIAIYVRELVAAWSEVHPEDQLCLYGHQLRRRVVRTPTDGVVPPASADLRAGRLPSRALPWLAKVGVGADTLLGGVDVLHLTDYSTLPSRSARVVATIHDCLFEELPDCYTPEMWEGLRTATARILANASQVIVPSARTRASLLRHFDADRDRVHVVSHGPRRLPDAEPEQRKRPYVLCVGTLEPRKNQLRLIRAFRSALGDRGEAELVLVGSRGWLDADIHEAISEAPRGSVTWLDAVGPTRLSALYAGATAVAYPSLGEGFGLPVLEAMHARLPLLVGDDTACSDLAGDAAIAVDPHSEHAIAEGLRRLVGDATLRGELRSRGVAVAARYTWQATVRGTRAVYQRALHREVAV